MNSLAFPPISAFDTIIFAGGGNRCFWQAGLMQHWTAKVRAQRFVGTSAGAAMATAFLASHIEVAISACQRLFDANPKFHETNRSPNQRGWFAHERIYPTWIAAFADATAAQKLSEDTRVLQIGVCRLPQYLPTSIGLALGTVGYLIDKHLSHRLHPKFPAQLGYVMQIIDVAQHASAAALQNLLVASAAAAPILLGRRLEGELAYDGGFADNAPRPEKRATDEMQLVLLTRHYPHRPRAFFFEERWYLQPSKRVPVSTFDCTFKTQIRGAFELGLSDARAFS